MSWNLWNRPSGSFMVDIVISSHIMKSPSPKCYMTLYHIQWHPQLIWLYNNLRTHYRTGLYYRFCPYYQILEVSIEHCNGCGKPTEDAYSSEHLVLSHLGLVFVLMLRLFFPELVMSANYLSFISRYFYFAYSPKRSQWGENIVPSWDKGGEILIT